MTVERRVIIVDDMKSARFLVRGALENDPKIKVVGEAADAFGARDLLKRANPDVMLLDIEMPHVRGDQFLRHVMTLRPLPVVMLSTLTFEGSPAAATALANGAAACVAKPRNAHEIADGTFSQRLRAAIHQAGGASAPAKTVVPPKPTATRGTGRPVVIVLGASTGGVGALAEVLSHLPADTPPVLIAQHMPGAFLPTLVPWLDARIKPRASIATSPVELMPGQVIFSPGGEHELVVTKSNPATARPVKRHGPSGGPSIDRLFKSLAGSGCDVVAGILTGMGTDGVQGLAAIKSAGGRTFAQDQETSIVWGMPQAAWQSGAAEQLVALPDIGPHILKLAAEAAQGAAR